MAVAKRYTDEAEKINKQILESHAYFSENVQRYHDCRKAIFKSSINENDEAFLSKLDWPRIECNVLKPYISRMRGEWSKQTPTISVSAKSDQISDDNLNEFLEGHFRAIIDDANQSQFENEIFNDSVTGGFSVMKVFTEYESDSGFNQVIKLGRVFDPTLCFFDPLARKSHKGDGEYCGEHFPMRAEDVEEIFGMDLGNVSFARGKDGFDWYYQTQNQKIAIVCHFYKKKYRKVRKVLLANGVTMDKDKYMERINNWDADGHIAVPPKIIKERDVKTTTICRYTLIGGQVKEYLETDFAFLPLVFVDGDSQLLMEGGATYQRTIPYIESAIDAQRMKNFTGQAFLHEITMMMKQHYMMPREAFPNQQGLAENWLETQKPSVLLYEDKDKEGNPLSPPIPVQSRPINPLLYQAFVDADDTVGGVLSHFNVNEGVAQKELSGLAIQEAASQSNASGFTYIMNYMGSLTQVAVIFLDLMPKYYVTPRTVPVVDASGERGFKMINGNTPDSISTKYDPSSLGVIVKAAVNFEIQRQQALDTMERLSVSLPAMQQLLEAPGAINVILDNIDIRGIDKLKEIAEEAQEAAAKNGPPPNPQMMAMQLKQQELQADSQYKQAQLQADSAYKQSQIQLQQQQMQIDAQNQDMQNQIKMLQVQQAQQTLDLSKYQTLLQAQLDARDQSIQIQKAGVEQEAHLEELQMAAMDMGHKHALDIHDRLSTSGNNMGV